MPAPFGSVFTNQPRTGTIAFFQSAVGNRAVGIVCSGVMPTGRSTMKIKLTLSVLVAFAFSASVFAAQNKVTKDTVPGINNYAHIETTVACAGAITPGSVAEIKKMGYASIINLREATEPGVIAPAQATVDKAGIRFVHVPFNGNK